jgi:hypothetical protein
VIAIGTGIRRAALCAALFVCALVMTMSEGHGQADRDRRLIAAARAGDTAAARKLGVNVNIADRDGVTPLAHAKRRGYAEMVRILEAAKAR